MPDVDAQRVPPHLIREELARIEHAAAFRQSEQLRALLRHLVLRTLDGEGGRLKEMALGIDVFRRPAGTFDPHKDPIVRVEAARLREKLARYYAEEGWDALVEVAVPVGSYRPEFRRRARPTQTGITIPSLIVLPVANLTGDDAQDAFCDALTEELIETFARLRGLKVIARVTAFSFKGRNEDVRTIGRKVGAATALEASVLQRGERVKAIAQLVQTSDGAHLWSRVFASDTADFSAFEEALAGDIALALQKQFSAHPSAHAWTAARRSLIRRGTADAGARALHDQARALLRKIRPSSQYRAIELFDEAARLDPQFALAHSGAGAAWTNLASMGAEPARRANAAALAAAGRALAIDPELNEALSVRAYVTYRDGLDPAAAEPLYRQGLRLNPSATYLRLGLAWLLAYTGRFDAAREQFEMVGEIDPLDVGLRHNLGHFLFVSREYEAAERELLRVLEVEPEDISARLFLVEVLLASGRHAQALPEARHVHAAAPQLVATRGMLAIALWLNGERAGADALVGELEGGVNAETSGAVVMAMVHAMRGDRDRAFAWLDAAADAHDIHLVCVPTHPLLDALHGDSRWSPWLARRGLQGWAAKIR
ncbi:MAG: tetratricopeptide repeat protein [Betaproteobacteria bacterium]|nr:tetratricopeptide repeat protein [Betaproteobacteria bacterium]